MFRENKAYFKQLTVVNRILAGQLSVAGVPFSTSMGLGSVFYVDPVNGSNSNSGLQQDQALLTSNAALALCTDDAGDVIVRLPGRESITAPIEFNKSGVLYISSAFGANPMQGGEVAHWTYPTAAYDAGPCCIISAPCAIVGPLEFVPRVAVAGVNDDGTDSGSEIVFIGEGGGYYGGFSILDGIRFVDWWGTPYGIEFAAGAYNVVQNCIFEGFNAGVYFRGTASNNPDHNMLRWNHFVDNVNGIEHAAGGTPHNFLYLRNTFVDYTDAIDFNQAGGGTCDGLVADNFYETATDAATYDCTVAQAQALGANLSGNHYSE